MIPLPTSWKKIPAEIKAMRVPERDDTAAWGSIAGWLGFNGADFYIEGTGDEPGNVIGISLHTLEGVMLARIGDWIIQGVAGEFYPCKPEIFEITYEPA